MLQAKLTEVSGVASAAVRQTDTPELHTCTGRHSSAPSQNTIQRHRCLVTVTQTL